MAKRHRRKLSRKVRAARNASRFKDGLEQTAWRSKREGSPLATIGKPVKTPKQPKSAATVEDIHSCYSVGTDLRITAKAGADRGFTPGAI